MIDQEFVKYIVTAIVSKPDEVKVERVVDERGVLLTLHVDEEDLGRVIGRKGILAQSLRVLLRALGSKNQAHYNLRIADGKDGDAERGNYDNLRREDVASPADNPPPAGDDAEPQGEEEPEQEGPEPESDQDTEPDQDKDDSILDKTKRELDSLNDLDI